MNARNFILPLLPLAVALVSSGCDLAPADPEPTDPEPTDPPTISIRDGGITAINVMDPAADDRDRLLEQLESGVTLHMQARDGFGGSAIHRSTDSNHVVNVARWDSVEDLAAAAELVQSGGAPEMAEAFSLATPDFHPYTIAAQWSTSGDPPYIAEDRELVTAINVLDPTDTELDAAALVTAMTEAIDKDVAGQPGFVSATLYRSLDSEHVVNYAQWESAEALGAMAQRVQTGDAPLLGAVFSAVPPSYHGYDVATVVVP